MGVLALGLDSNQAAGGKAGQLALRGAGGALTAPELSHSSASGVALGSQKVNCAELGGSKRAMWICKGRGSEEGCLWGRLINHPRGLLIWGPSSLTEPAEPVAHPQRRQNG